MSGFWLFVVSAIPGQAEGEEILRHRFQERFWGLNVGTHSVKQISKGDNVVFYSKKHFLGTATIGSDVYRVQPERDYWLRDRFRHAYGVDLSQSEVWTDKLPIDSVLDKLELIVHKDMWQVHIQGGVRELTQADFEIIISTHNKPPEHLELLFVKELSSSEIRDQCIRFPTTLWKKLDKRNALSLLVKEQVVDMQMESRRMFPKSIPWNEFESIAGFGEKDYVLFKRRKDRQIELFVIHHLQ